MNSFLLLFILEIIAGANAGLLFSFVPRPLAGLIASSVFCLVGLGALWIFYKQAHRWRIVSLLITIVYLFLFTIPLVILRASTPEDQVLDSVFSIPVPIFHRGSEFMFLILMLMTAAQWSFVRTKVK